MSEVLTVRLDTKSKRRLEKLAAAMERSRSGLAADAIRAYLDVNDWQIAQTKAALKEADAGKFASEDEVKATMVRLRRRAR